MAPSPGEPPREKDQPKTDPAPAISEQLPAPIYDAIQQIPDEKSRALLQIAVSRNSFGIGPDPETAKTLAQAEMHEEECRLKAYQASLAGKAEQGKLDHDFRKKKLNHASLMTGGLMAAAVGGIIAGVWLSATGNPRSGAQ